MKTAICPFEEALEGYTPQQRRFTSENLSEEDIRAIGGTRDTTKKDYLHVAVANFAVLKKGSIYEILSRREKTDRCHYVREESPWIEFEQISLEAELSRVPTGRELNADFENHSNGKRFYAFYCSKFPEMTKKR